MRGWAAAALVAALLGGCAPELRGTRFLRADDADGNPHLLRVDVRGAAGALDERVVAEATLAALRAEGRPDLETRTMRLLRRSREVHALVARPDGVVDADRELSQLAVELAGGSGGAPQGVVLIVSPRAAEVAAAIDQVAAVAVDGPALHDEAALLALVGRRADAERWLAELRALEAEIGAVAVPPAEAVQAWLARAARLLR